MATAKKLPSGSWRCQAYSHTERVMDEKTGKWKDKRIYESITSDDPSPRGKKEAEAAAALFQLEKEKYPRRNAKKSMTLTEAIDDYIESRVTLRRSPTTIQDYKCIQKNAFQDLMDYKLRDLDETILQEAINVESKRASQKRCRIPKPISAKRLKNEWSLMNSVLNKYCKGIELSGIELPQISPRSVELPSADKVLTVIKDTDIELPVLLAAWLSFSMSEVRGLTKSKSISGDGNYLTIKEVVVDVDGKPHRKDMAKNPTRNRKHRIPEYIKQLIDAVEEDILVPISGRALYHRWIKLQDENDMQHITFHDLRHLNASVMALLRIPDKYAQERGGWKSDQVMKSVYMNTFSEEREKVDNIIDNFFGNIATPSNEDIDKSKYKAWLTLFEREENIESKKEFLAFMQHEIQHNKKRA